MPDETGVYKNSYRKLQKELGLHCLSIQHLDQVSGTRLFLRERLNWPEIGIRFTGEPAKNKKQAEKNAAMAAWTSLKLCESEPENNDELEQITIARALLNYQIKEKTAMANSSNAPVVLTNKFPSQNPRPTGPQPPATTSKILTLICPKVVPRNRSMSATANEKPVLTSLQTPTPESRGVRP
ncbi:double-stranded RNA-binding protein 2-like [Gossypium arboreum]|uniref:double-stranded RNA-binding protein 2-like n=1 Tax=Gossypium arboreum TaxID=29729 RepID=UPI0022F17D3E|nr:double-stranded RNA-binding protein 2-like [Gossypium arboreum]